MEVKVGLSLLVMLQIISACDIMKKLKSVDHTSLKGVYCSPQLTRVKGSFIKEENFIGFYRKTFWENHVCYYEKVKDDLVKLSSLSGGTMYTVGEWSIWLKLC